MLGEGEGAGGVKNSFKPGIRRRETTQGEERKAISDIGSCERSNHSN